MNGMIQNKEISRKITTGRQLQLYLTTILQKIILVQDILFSMIRKEPY